MSKFPTIYLLRASWGYISDSVRLYTNKNRALEMAQCYEKMEGCTRVAIYQSNPTPFNGELDYTTIYTKVK